MNDDPLRAACLVAGIELEEPIARGRHATVWRARWRERDVAVKLLAEGGRSGRPARRLSHPSILDVLDTGEALGRRFIVFERFPTDLRRLLAGRPLRRELLRPVLVALVDALDHAHRRGVVHGDLKPANVLVDPAARPPRVALCDFGAGPEPDAAETLEASITSRERDEWQGSTATVAYLAPERLAGAAASPAADVYSLGVLLFEVLTGRLPSALERPSEVAPGLDRRWDALVKAALAREPAARPRLEAVRRDLLRLLPRAGELAPEPEPVTVVPEGARHDGMVLIPAGHLILGDRDDPDARPMHEVALPAFWLDRTPVTHREYAEFIAATGGRHPRPRTWPARGRVPARLLDLPVTGVAWADADAFARWAGKRLPTEQEWERAAQGPEHRRYPYGDAFDPARVHAALAPVGTRPEGASSEGVHDLTGALWQWTASPFVPYGRPAPDPLPPAHPRTIRGGHDPKRPRTGSATFRAGLRPDVADPLVGFRCARSASPAPPPGC